MSDTTAAPDAPQTVEEQLAATQAALATLQAAVRVEAARAKETQGWCAEEVNKALGRMGLPKLPERKTYTFDVPSTGVVRYQIAAYDPDNATAELERMIARDSTTDRLRYGCKVGALSFDVEKATRSGGHTPDELAGTVPVAVSTGSNDDEDDDEDDDY